MAAPGQPIEIKLSSSVVVSGKTLNLRQKQSVVRLLKQAQESQDAAFDLLIEAVEICCPELSEEQWDVIDERAAGEIISKTLAAASLTEEERKKSV